MAEIGSRSVVVSEAGQGAEERGARPAHRDVSHLH